MDSKDLAQYIESTNGISKPWLLVQLRLKKLQERKDSIPPGEYLQEVQDMYVFARYKVVVQLLIHFLTIIYFLVSCLHTAVKLKTKLRADSFFRDHISPLKFFSKP